MKLSNKTKSELFKALLQESSLFSFIAQKDLMLRFLNDIWDLRAMPSEDSRFNDAYGDIVQHTVNNDDWDTEYLLIERLKLYQDENIYLKFLETLVKSEYRENEDEVMKFVLLVNSYIEKDQLALSIKEYNENEQAVYSIQNLEDKNLFIDIAQNQIPFYVVKSPNGRNDRFSSHTEPEKKPSFILVHNDGWNDYSFWTIFSLFFYKSTKERLYIGETKITNGIDGFTTSVIPDTFFTLPDSFCSLGQKLASIKTLKTQQASCLKAFCSH